MNWQRTPNAACAAAGEVCGRVANTGPCMKAFTLRLSSILAMAQAARDSSLVQACLMQEPSRKKVPWKASPGGSSSLDQ
eukprot:3903294-Heterocapsa_arctica.AAC.1